MHKKNLKLSHSLVEKKSGRNTVVENALIKLKIYFKFCGKINNITVHLAGSHFFLLFSSVKATHRQN